MQQRASALAYRARFPLQVLPVNPVGIVFAILIGALLPLQALVNASLGKQSFGAVFASLCSFLVGTVVLLAWWLASRPALELATLAKLPWWAWLGGLIGAAYVASVTLLVPRLGAGALICLVVLGQIVGSLLLDHFGVLHPRQPIDATKLLGAVLVLVGAVLVVKPWQGLASA